jgi:hypothetical protein
MSAGENTREVKSRFLETGLDGPHEELAVERPRENAVNSPLSRRRSHFWSDLRSQWSLLSEWRGWPLIRSYMPAVSGFAAWIFMGVLSTTGPATGVWFAEKGETKLGATGFCESK